MTIDFSKYKNVIDAANLVNYLGYVTQIVGLTIESRGPQVSIGEICTIKADGKEVKTNTELNAIRDTHKIGDEMTITVYRDGNEKELTVKLQEAP